MINLPLLKIENLNKKFGITQANRDICLELRHGEVRGLAGENGSGKSTLASILAGIYLRTSGDIYVNGKPYDPKSPLDAQNHRIGIVVQEMGLVNDLSLALNLFLGDMSRFNKRGILNMERLNREASENMEKCGFHGVRLQSTAGSNSVEVRKQVEIARALSCSPEILILDEVSQSFSHDKRKILYNIIENCKSQGIGVLFISHDLEELVHLSDSITVLRDGEVVDTVLRGNVSVSELKQMMVGREISGDYYRVDDVPSYRDDVALSVRNLTSAQRGIEDVSFDLHKGEILACCGLSDGGIHELGKTVFGIMERKQGTVTVTSSGKQIENAIQASDSGMAYVPKDRDNEAIMLGASIRENFILPSIPKMKKRFGYLSEKEISDKSDGAVNRFDVKCTGIRQIIGHLSGGNKQKVNLGRWLSKDAEIYILDCPTRGVDVSVKAYIYHVLKEAKAAGAAILLISDELAEAIGMGDRIMVMANGKMKQIVDRGPAFTEEVMIEVMI